jgi:hypothetical protein
MEASGNFRENAVESVEEIISRGAWKKPHRLKAFLKLRFAINMKVRG